MRGSKFELRFDYKGQAVNEEEIRYILKKDKKNHAASKKSEEEKTMSLWRWRFSDNEISGPVQTSTFICILNYLALF